MKLELQSPRLNHELWARKGKEGAVCSREDWFKGQTIPFDFRFAFYFPRHPCFIVTVSIFPVYHVEQLLSSADKVKSTLDILCHPIFLSATLRVPSKACYLQLSLKHFMVPTA